MSGELGGPMTPHGSTASTATGLRVLSLFLGVFFLCMGLDKLAWLADPAGLTAELQEWRQNAPPVSRWYLDTVAVPGAAVFARLVLVGELAVGIALLAGVQPRLAALAGMFMVLNFHFAIGILLHYSYLWNGYGPPVLGGLLALVIGGAQLPFSVRWGPAPAERAHARDSGAAV